MENLLKTKQLPETKAVVQFLSEMSPTEQQEFLVFMQGMRFAKGLVRDITVADQNGNQI